MMLGVGDTMPEFKVTGVKAGFTQPEEKGESAFFEITDQSFAGQWKLIYFYPKDFTFVCPTEIVGFDNLVPEFTARNCVVLGGSTDNEFCKLAWRREHKDLTNMKQIAFADTNGSLVDGLGVRDMDAGVCLRATYLVDPDNIVQHVSVNNLSVGRNPDEILRLLDGFQTGELCQCNRETGTCTLKIAA